MSRLRLMVAGACHGLFGRLRSDQRGTVMLILALSLLPLVFATGMGIDYARAMKLQTKLNSAADAAALAAVSLPMMSQPNSMACAAARNMFTTQASGLGGLILDVTDPAQLKITITDSQSKGSAGTTTDCGAASSAVTAASYSRTVSVAYRGQSTNAFANILGLKTLTVKGTSQTNAAVAPNIDFFLVLDTSPSMAIAATQSGIDTMVANTSAQGGCAFACHQISVGNNSNDTVGNPMDPNTGQQMDNYALARSLNVVLRSDLVTQAAANLMDVATSTSQTNHAVYRMSVSTIDTNFNNVQPLTSNLAQAKTSAQNVQQLQVYSNSYLTQTNNNDDTDTSFAAMQSGLSQILPSSAGNGTNAAGDRPQDILFIVTDGVRDEAVGGNPSNRYMGELERPFSTDPQMCEYLKSVGYRVAILYTTYLPLPTNWFYNQNIAPFQPNIGTNLKACASPGLFYQVSTGDDISAALAALFQKAVATAHLTR